MFFSVPRQAREGFAIVACGNLRRVPPWPIALEFFSLCERPTIASALHIMIYHHPPNKMIV